MQKDISSLFDYYEFIYELTNSNTFISGNFKDFIKEALQKSYPLFNTTRMSFWLFSEDRNYLECEFFFEGEHFIRGPRIRVEDCPIYFKNLQIGKTVIASLAQQDPITKELKEIYLKPEKVISLFDTAIHDGEKIIGVISLENRQHERQWSNHEVKLSKIICNLISNCFIVSKKRIAEINLERLRDENKEISLTLKNVLTHIENQKKVQQENIALNIEQNITPLVEELKSHVGNNLTSLLESNLNSLTSNFYRRLARYNLNLTPTEIKVCQHIKAGLRGKEIAQRLNLSLFTIETHKKNIRKKLGLTGKPKNLKVALEEIDQEETID